MAGMLETPSRIWRRIEAVQDREMPSLPSLPSFDDSDGEESAMSRVLEESEDDLNDSLGDMSLPVHSTPATSNHTATVTLQPPLSAASTARFAHSIASRSSKSSIGPTAMNKSGKDSFDITPKYPPFHADSQGTAPEPLGRDYYEDERGPRR
ncbi:hypothetical protein NMY22_g16432 [Coprinellus aureogranulatus]|nr:hypothetical protein NMY22_g16432 [Coprinellus aureogranulatus]